MYGDEWQDILRSTPCLNVVPFRTPSRKKLPDGAWDAAQPWFRQVLKHLQPDLIICNGNGEKKEASAWAALKEFNTITGQKQMPTTDKAAIKYGRVTSGPMEGVAVIRLPHLSKPFFWPDDGLARAGVGCQGYPGVHRVQGLDGPHESGPVFVWLRTARARIEPVRLGILTYCRLSRTATGTPRHSCSEYQPPVQSITVQSLQVIAAAVVPDGGQQPSPLRIP